MSAGGKQSANLEIRDHLPGCLLEESSLLIWRAEIIYLDVCWRKAVSKSGDQRSSTWMSAGGKQSADLEVRDPLPGCLLEESSQLIWRSEIIYLAVCWRKAVS
jgi:hypothetical protein